MLKKLILFFTLLLSYNLYADCYIREYTYNVGDDESRIHAKNIVINQLKKNLIEELGVYIITETNIKNNIDINIKTKIISECVTNFFILNEKWDGYTYYIKAKICVNEKDLKKRLKNISYKFTNENSDNLNNNFKKQSLKKETINWITSTINYSPNIYSFVIEGGQIKKIYLIGLYYIYNIGTIDDNYYTYNSYGLNIGFSFFNNKIINFRLYNRFGLISSKYLYIEPNVKLDILIKNNINLTFGGAFNFNNYLPNVNIGITKTF